MARIRSVHPSLFTCDEWVSCSHLARILYIGLWTDADDQGVFEWKPLQIKMRLLPGDSTDAKELLSELEGVDLIRRFNGPDGAYGAIKDFRKFQRPQKPNAVHDLPDNLRSYVRIDGGEDDPTTGIRKELCEEQGRACYYCSTEITHYSKRINSCEIDHKVPKSKGGTDERSNLVASCRSCNRGKCDKSEAEWFAILESRVRKSHEKSASTIVAPQMEDGGGRMDDEAEDKSSVPKPAKESKPRPLKRCPESWSPSEKAISVGFEEGLSEEQVRRELAVFRDYTFSSSKTDWDGTFRNWLRRAAERKQPNRNHADDAVTRAENAKRDQYARIAQTTGFTGEQPF